MRAIVAFYDRFLTTPAGEETPYRDTLISIRTEVEALANGAPPTDYSMMCLCTSMRHFYTGIPAEEIGLPGPTPQETAEHKVFVTEIAELLKPRAALCPPLAQKVVEDLGANYYPRSPQEMVLLLSLFLTPPSLLKKLSRRAAALRVSA